MYTTEGSPLQIKGRTLGLNTDRLQMERKTNFGRYFTRYLKNDCYLARLTLDRCPPLRAKPCSPTGLKSARGNSSKSSFKQHASMTSQYQSSLNSLPHRTFSLMVPPNTHGSWDVYAILPVVITEPWQVPISPKMACNRLDCKKGTRTRIEHKYIMLSNLNGFYLWL